MVLDNDTRGWIMTCISGVACVIGASIICVDVFVRQLPRMQDFSISKSDAFLSASLSLSFGVMLFSALYSMLPQSKIYLEDGGFSPSAASYLLIGLFLGGVVGIQILSGVLHRFIPSHVVDCDHTHEDQESQPAQDQTTQQNHHDHRHFSSHSGAKLVHQHPDEDNEDTPLLSRTTSFSPSKPRQPSAPDETGRRPHTENGLLTNPTHQKPSMMPRTLSRTFSRYVAGKKDNCDETGPCMGYSDPCGQNCFRVLQKRGSILPGHSQSFSRTPTWKVGTDETRLPASINDTDHFININGSAGFSSSTPELHRANSVPDAKCTTDHHHHPETEAQQPDKSTSRNSSHSQGGAEHHHHVPTNAFMSIGLQTSLAIALHKAPEGFITYATNHANPTLGFTVFMALFIHNITEGFAMSLPLYLALGSRLKAIVWSSVLGGVSQPLGAGVAALWFRLARGSQEGAPGEGVYGGMFAITAGVMTTVGLSLFSESLQLSHNKSTCIVFAFLGMGILGFSFALTAK